MSGKSKIFVVVGVVIILIFSSMAIILKSADNSPAGILPFNPILSFDSLPHLNSTSILTYKLTLDPSFYNWYGSFYGNGTVVLILPEGIVSTNNTETPLDLTIGEEPYIQNWTIKPILNGNWTMRVFFNYTYNASKNSHTVSSINHPCTTQIGVNIQNNISSIINYSYTPTTPPDNGVNQTNNGTRGSIMEIPRIFNNLSEYNNTPLLEQLNETVGSIYNNPLFEQISDNSPFLDSNTTSVPSETISSSPIEPIPLGTFKVIGDIYYTDPELGQRPARWLEANIWDDSIFGDSKLATILVDINGHFESGFLTNSDEWGTRDIYVEFVPDNSAAHVNSEWGAEYSQVTSTFWDISDGTLNVGGWTTSTHGAYRIFQYLMDGWNYMVNGPAGYTPPRVIATWKSGHSADYGCGISTTHYDYHESWQFFYHTMHIDGRSGSDDSISPDVIIHEYGHHLMFCAYGDWISPNAHGSHWFDQVLHSDLAWSEGWADFIVCPVRGDLLYTDYAQGFAVNIEARQWYYLATPGTIYNINNIGDNVEGNVWGSLYDIFDSVNDGHDSLNAGFLPIWNIIFNYNDYNFADFWGSWQTANAGNNFMIHFAKAAIYQNKIYYDLPPAPSLSPLTILSSSTNGYYHGTIAMNVDGISDPDIEDAIYLRCRFEYSSNSGATWTIFSDTTNDQYSRTADWVTTSLSDGIYYLRAVIDDDMIEVSTALVIVTIDNNVPTTPSLSSPANGAITTDATPTFDWSGSTDSYSGIWQYRIVVDDNSGFTSIDYDWAISGTPPSSTYTPTSNMANGYWYWTVCARDIAGNWGSWASYRGLRIDTVAPTGSIVINSGNAWTSSTSVTLGLTYSDGSGSGVYQVRYSNDGSTWTAWESPSATKSWSLTSGDGIKTVYYQIKDNAGITSTTYSDTIGLDTTVPTGSIIINSGSAWVSSTSVTLGLTYSDGSGCGVYQVRYSNDGSTWTAWESPSATKAWTLTSGDGTKTVYYQIKDNGGWTSTTYSDTIGLDTTAPTGSIIINSGSAWVSSTSVTLGLTYSDGSGCGVYQVQYSNDGSTWTAWESPSATKAWTLTSGDGTKTVYYQIKDNAGWTSTTYSDTISLDTTAPTASIMINNDARYVGGELVYPNPVTLNIYATDNVLQSGVSQYRYKRAGYNPIMSTYYEGDWSAWFPWPNPSTTSISPIIDLGKGVWGLRIVYLQVMDNAGNIVGIDPAGTQTPPGSIYDTIVFISTDPNQPKPNYDEILVSVDVNITISMSGIPGNYIQAIIFENDRPINSTIIFRESGNPMVQSQTLWLKYYTSILSDGTNITEISRHYRIEFYYFNVNKGANPVKLYIESGGYIEKINLIFNSQRVTEVINIDDVLESVTSNSSTYYFQTISHCICQWDFGDGSAAAGEFVDHSYVNPGTYLITLTYVDEVTEEVMYQIMFEIEIS
ncbi:MAG: hypothetical protein KKH41_03420 [Candidatus Thermoplasmatota archaeon]|nr:hypothetical protein [Candidatus Thermoplasmatota archaeon]MBU4591616.1 hypothetical protein [Candidatus Thermoplasmatota archaeon]